MIAVVRRVGSWPLEVSRADRHLELKAWQRGGCLAASSFEPRADVVLLQESPKPDWHSGVVWDNVPHGDWGSAVLTATGTIRKLAVEGYEGWAVGGELVGSGLDAAERPLYAFSIHAPTGNDARPRRQYVEEVVGILDVIGCLVGRLVPSHADLVLGGDFNFLSLGNRKEGESIATTAAEREALVRFAQMGLVSCWTTAHPGGALPQTLRWSGDKTADKATPYHCDGIFVPASWKSGTICEILTLTCFEVSDHYPVAAWIVR